MIVGALAAGALISMFYSVDKSMKADEEALRKYARAFEIEEEAALAVRKKAEITDKRLLNVAKKKRAVIEVTIPKFVEVYSVIQKVEISERASVNEIAIREGIRQLSTPNVLSISVKKDFTDKELVCGWFFKGLGKMMEKDSERYLSAANMQISSANTASSHAESIMAVYDAVIARADRISKLLASMNVLFLKSIEETKATIERNGENVRNYSEFDKDVLMNCVNFAVAMSDLINIPVVDEQGRIGEEAERMLLTSEDNLKKMDKLIKRLSI